MRARTTARLQQNADAGLEARRVQELGGPAKGRGGHGALGKPAHEAPRHEGATARRSRASAPRHHDQHLDAAQGSQPPAPCRQLSPDADTKQPAEEEERAVEPDERRVLGKLNRSGRANVGHRHDLRTVNDPSAEGGGAGEPLAEPKAAGASELVVHR